MYKVKVNEEAERLIEIAGERISIDGNAIIWDQIELGKNRFHVLKNHRSFLCEVLSADAQRKSFGIKVNGKIFHAEVKDRFDELLHQLGMDKVASSKVNVIKAPMPGLVLKVIVQVGDQIKAGDSLVILEAMKMENVIKSPGEGLVKTVNVRERETVDKNQVLVQLT